MSHFRAAGVSDWLCDALAAPPFEFVHGPLPVQAAVVPFATRAFASWMLHCDVGLSSPTGSGKTLCYALPLLHAIVEQRERFRGGFPDRQLRGVVVVPTALLAEQVFDVLCALAGRAEIVVGALFRANEDASNLSERRRCAGGRRCSTVDVVVATPQKMCSWIERLADEEEEQAEQEEGQQHQQQQQQHQQQRGTTKPTAADPLADVFGRTQLIVLDEADDLLSTSFFTSMAGRIVDTVQAAVLRVGETVLHKMLCSATLTSRISKVSDVKLQNAKYFSLDASGVDIAASTTSSSVSGSGDVVRPLFPLPASLVENLVIVRDDTKRHVTLLTTVQHALAELRAIAASAAADGDRRRGSSVIVFCQSAEVARVMGHFLSLAGIEAIELTTLTSETERRRAALAVAASSSTEQQKVIVASDALMRGIDLPGVGAVVMYDPPTTLQQYIHRVGRTARAGARGDSYVLLSKRGASGTEADGQVAHFKQFDAMLLRNGRVFNAVKLRELPEEQVSATDAMLVETQRRLQAMTGGEAPDLLAVGGARAPAAAGGGAAASGGGGGRRRSRG